jgi:hypothetical protein
MCVAMKTESAEADGEKVLLAAAAAYRAALGERLLRLMHWAAWPMAASVRW